MEENLRFFLTKGDITGYKKIIDSVDINYTTKSGSSYLHYAIASSNYSEDIVIDLLKRGIDINKLDSNNRSPLECCCEYNRIYIAKLLLEKGANVNSIDRWGNNPLWRAVFKRNVEMVRLLMSYGANPNNINKAGKSPLNFAHQIEDLKMIDILLGKG